MSHLGDQRDQGNQRDQRDQCDLGDQGDQGGQGDSSLIESIQNCSMRQTISSMDLF